MRRLLRGSVLVASLTGVAATLAPTPAQAVSSGDFSFTGTATASGHGIAYTFVGSNTGDVDPTKDPLTHRNSATVVFTSSSCVGTVVNVTKPGKHAVEEGLCSITASGTIHGYCDLASGHLIGHVGAAGPAVPSPLQSYSFDVSFHGVGGVLVLSGHYSKPGHTGALKAEALIVPNPTSGSCTNKLQKGFIVAGTATAEGALSGTSLPPKPSPIG